ncbi:MAG TPA: OmpH family outer membrane protein [Bryobacteraceae bacterium]|nr:OmpH family outer membrane protein [Bryobacteraceae bacterium]
MKKNYAVLAFLAAVGFALPAAAQAPAAPAAAAAVPSGPLPTKVGIINAAEALSATKEGQKAADELQKNFVAPRKAELDKLQESIQTNTTKLRNGSATMSADAQRALQNQIDADNKSFTRKQEDAQQEVQDQEGKIMQELGAKMMTVLEKYAADNGFAVILDVGNQQTPVLWAAPGLDVTADIVKLYDEKYPATATAAPAAPAAKAPVAPAARPPAAAPKKP